MRRRSYTQIRTPGRRNMARRRHRFRAGCRHAVIVRRFPCRVRKYRRVGRAIRLSRTTAFHMRRNGRPYQTHRRLPRALRPFGVRGNIRRPAKIIHKRTFAHSESDVRQTLQRDAFQPRSGRHIRFSQSADHVAVRNRLRRNKKPGSHRNRPQGITASGWRIK